MYLQSFYSLSFLRYGSKIAALSGENKRRSAPTATPTLLTARLVSREVTLLGRWGRHLPLSAATWPLQQRRQGGGPLRVLEVPSCPVPRGQDCHNPTLTLRPRTLVCSTTYLMELPRRQLHPVTLQPLLLQQPPLPLEELRGSSNHTTRSSRLFPDFLASTTPLRPPQPPPPSTRF